MASKYFKAFNFFKSKVSPTIKSVKPTFPKTKMSQALRDVKITALKTRGSIKKSSQDLDRDIQKVKSKLGQSMQKLKGEPVTESGVSKGMNIIKKATGGRVGLKRGTFPDYSGDGKTTMKDILMGRGVIPKPKNKKMAKKSKSPMDKAVRKA